jgi:UDP-glucose 4-epimerase
MIDVVREITDIAGYDVPIDDLGERAGDVTALYSWSRKLAAATGWRAQVELRDGLQRTVEWFRGRSL